MGINVEAVSLPQNQMFNKVMNCKMNRVKKNIFFFIVYVFIHNKLIGVSGDVPYINQFEEQSLDGDDNAANAEVNEGDAQIVLANNDNNFRRLLINNLSDNKPMSALVKKGSESFSSELGSELGAQAGKGIVVVGNILFTFLCDLVVFVKEKVQYKIGKEKVYEDWWEEFAKVFMVIELKVDLQEKVETNFINTCVEASGKFTNCEDIRNYAIDNMIKRCIEDYSKEESILENCVNLEQEKSVKNVCTPTKIFQNSNNNEENIKEYKCWFEELLPKLTFKPLSGKFKEKGKEKFVLTCIKVATTHAHG